MDLSNNNLKDITPLNSLTHLLTLKLDFNKLTSAKLDPLPYLQHASFSNNKIKSTEGIAHPKLEILNLNSMLISIDLLLSHQQAVNGSNLFFLLKRTKSLKSKASTRISCPICKRSSSERISSPRRKAFDCPVSRAFLL
jgi:Leucine-rich repeat (LRR) protein